MAAELELRWLNRYLNRELIGTDRDWFESYLLEKPDLLVFVEADLALGDGLRALADDGVLNTEQLQVDRCPHRPKVTGRAGGLLLALCTTLFLVKAASAFAATSLSAQKARRTAALSLLT
jgi:hypothetical protein